MTVDVKSILEKAAEDNRVVPGDWMPIGSVRPIILGDPGEVWLKFHGASEFNGESHDLRPDLLSPYSFVEFIADKERGFKQKWIKENVKGARQVCEESYHHRYADKLRKTLDLMLIEKALVIVQPALWWAPERIYGAPDLLVHTSWLEKHFKKAWRELKDHTPSGEKRDGYVIFELRFTTRDADKPDTDSVEATKAQIRLNTYILGHLQDWMPPLSFLITRNAVDQPGAVEIRSQLKQPLDDDLKDFRDQFLEIKLNGDKLVPWHDDMVRVSITRQSERWKTAKSLIAWEKTKGDPRALYLIGDRQKPELARMGFESIDAMLEVDPGDIQLEQLEYSKTQRMGSLRANRIRAILRSNRTGTPVLPNREALPSKKEYEFFVDFEYFNNQNVNFNKEWPDLDGREMLFMIGVGWEEQGEWKFGVFIAKKDTVEAEAEMIEEFVQFLDSRTKGAFVDAGKTSLYHWASPEKWQSGKAADRVKLDADHAFRGLPWVDLLERFLETPCAVPGAWDYGLKSVAKALGKLSDAYDPKWVGDLDSGRDAMVMGWKAYQKGSPAKSNEMKILKQYLEADCRALWCVLRWMRAGDPGLPFDAPDQTYVRWEKVKKGFSKPTSIDAFAGFKNGQGVVVYQQPLLNDDKGIQAVKHLVWGDWLRVVESQRDWRKIVSRGTSGWVHEKFVSNERLLEVNFVDVGQGDGCFIVTPDDKKILVDAGKNDNMYRFLRWRFGHFKREIEFSAAIITHPDNDHFGGFADLFSKEDKAVQNVRFKCVYHNGIINPRNKKKGPLVVEDKAGLQERLQEASPEYRDLLEDALESGRVDDIRMICAGPFGSTPGPTPLRYVEDGKDQPIKIEVLGPVPEGQPGSRRLRWLGTSGKTKNGHSVILRLCYGNVRILLGGDLNIKAEEYLLGHYGGIKEPYEKLTWCAKRAMIATARKFFHSDIAKACHHGSADFNAEFLRAIDAVVTVVSSGDDESHSHPQPETLGALGKYSRGNRPLIYNTELARSTKDRIKHPYELRQKLEKIRGGEQEAIDALVRELGRSVAVYGMISLRTDGKKVVMVQKRERRKSRSQEWDMHLLSPDKDGCLQYVSKHED